jgi:hypothetical protein
LHEPKLHVPVEQSPVPFANVHGLPQLPQLVVVVPEVSQPLGPIASHSSQPGLQAPCMHAPPGQVADAFGKLHVTPQPLQFAVVLSGVSQPLVTVPSQLPKPEEQLPTAHVPLAHDSVEFGYGPHVTPQPPQLVSVVPEVSQPSGPAPLHSRKPELHVPWVHVPAGQLADALGKLHRVPQPPQLLVVVSAVSQPLVAMPSQFPKPPLQPTTHVPVGHDSVEFGYGPHVTPQPPQLLVEWIDVSQPLVIGPVQCAVPAAQLAIAQVPDAQLSVELG